MISDQFKTRYTAIITSLMVICLGLPVSVTGQVQLERISVTDRADGMGFVLRHHLTSRPDSFKVSQTELNKIQVIIYDEDLLYQNYRAPDDEIIQHIEIIPLPFGVGFQYLTRKDRNFLANAYYDQNQRDILISLEPISQQELADVVSVSPTLFEPESLAEAPYLREPVNDTGPEPVEPAETSERTFSDFLNTISPTSLDRVTPGDPFELYLRAVYPQRNEIGQQSTFLLRPISVSSVMGQTESELHPWMDHKFFNELSDQDESVFQYRFYTPVLYRSNNSALPLGQNDGILWQGRGTNYFLSGGVGVQYGPITAVFRPQYVYSENLEFPEIEVFDISVHPRYGGSEYQMFLTHADLPLRFGDHSLSTFDLGDTFIQAEYNGISAGVSNERMWTGPAVHNPLIFSNHAPGFIHGFLRTSKPFKTRYGNIEGNWIWGRLKESDFYDDNPDNNNRYITAFSLNYSPSLVSGLHVGFTRAAYSYTGNRSFISDLIMAFKPSQPHHITDPEEAIFNMSSYYARWVFPKANFEMYAEWGRHDNRRKFRDILAEPELNRGYVLGFLKNFKIRNNRSLLWNTEIVKLENSSVTATKRDFNIWYTNPVIGQGFTHKGRVLGAGIGPGSSTQQMHLHYYDKWGRVGLSASRIAHFMDRHFRYEDYYRSFANYPQYYFILSRHEIEMRYGFDLMIFLPHNFELEMGYIISKIENRHNLRHVDFDNYQYSFTIRYTTSGYSR